MRPPRLLLRSLLPLSLAVATPPCTPPCAADTPVGVPKDFDCAIRRFTLEMARKRALGPPGYDLSTVHDALQLGSKCGVAFSEPSLAPPTPRAAQGRGARGGPADVCRGACTYVDPARGDDEAAGTLDAPLRTVAAGVAAARRAAAPASVVLRGGTHWLTATLTLTPADSGLTIRGYAGERAVINGGVPLSNLSWAPHTAQPGVWVRPRPFLTALSSPA